MSARYDFGLTPFEPVLVVRCDHCGLPVTRVSAIVREDGFELMVHTAPLPPRVLRQVTPADVAPRVFVSMRCAACNASAVGGSRGAS